MCVSECVWVSVCVCVCVCEYVSVCVCVCVCVSLDLLTQHAKRMHRILLSCVACMAVPYFSTFSHKCRDFQENVTEHKMFDFTFSTTCAWNISHSKKGSSRCHHKCLLHVKYPLFYSDFSATCHCKQIFEKYSNIKFHENTFIGSRVIPCGETDMTKLMATFRKFV